MIGHPGSCLRNPALPPRPFELAANPTGSRSSLARHLRLDTIASTVLGLQCAPHPHTSARHFRGQLHPVRRSSDCAVRFTHRGGVAVDLSALPGSRPASPHSLQYTPPMSLSQAAIFPRCVAPTTLKWSMCGAPPILSGSTESTNNDTFPHW
jgi:hypothetical protein